MHIQQTPLMFDASGKPVMGFSQNVVVGNNEERPLIGSIKILTEDDDFKLVYLKNFSKKGLEKTLSARELEIFELLSQSKPTKEIATTLSISENTVWVHRKRILKN